MAKAGAPRVSLLAQNVSVPFVLIVDRAHFSKSIHNLSFLPSVSAPHFFDALIVVSWWGEEWTMSIATFSNYSVYCTYNRETGEEDCVKK